MEFEKLSAEQAQKAFEQPSLHAPRPDFNGLRMKHPARPEVYLIDNGQKRWIPNPGTYTNLFGSWDGIYIYPEIDSVDTGPTISAGASLIRGDQSPQVYLVDNGVKRWIINPDVFNKYFFDWNKVRVVPQIVIDFVPAGSNIQ